MALLMAYLANKAATFTYLKPKAKTAILSLERAA
jgi:hypothetical protein